MISRRTCQPTPAVVRTRPTLAASSKMPSAVQSAPWDGWFCRRLYTIVSDCAWIKLDFYAHQFPGDAAVAAISIAEVVIEDVLSGALSRVLFSGAQTKTLSAGAANQLSDVIHAHYLGLPIFAAGRQVAIRMRGTVAQGANFPVCTRNGGAEKVTFYETATCTISPVFGAGTMSVTSGSNSTLGNGTYEPVLIGLRNSTSSPAAIMATGDSLYDNHEPSFPRLSANDAGYALLELSRGGMSQASLAGDLWWTPYLAYTSVLVDDMGTNASTDTTSFSTYWSVAKNTYGCAVYHTGLYPRASASSDSYATLSGQTAFASWNPPAVEPYLDARVADGTLAGQFRPAGIRDAATNKWAVDGTANKYTSDGVHPSAFADAAIKAEFDTVLAGWMSGRLAPTT